MKLGISRARGRGRASRARFRTRGARAISFVQLHCNLTDVYFAEIGNSAPPPNVAVGRKSANVPTNSNQFRFGETAPIDILEGSSPGLRPPGTLPPVQNVS